MANKRTLIFNLAKKINNYSSSAKPIIYHLYIESDEVPHVITIRPALSQNNRFNSRQYGG